MNLARSIGWVWRGKRQAPKIGLIATALLISACVWLAFRHAFPDRPVFVLFAPVVTFVVMLRGARTPWRGIVVAAPVIAFLLIGVAMTVQPAGRIELAALLGLFCLATVFAVDRYAYHRRTSEMLHERQQAILDGVPAAVFLFDVAGTVKLFSAASERMFGWTSEDIVGRPVWLLFPPAAHATIRGCLATAAYEGEPEDFGRSRITLGLRLDGSTFEVELSVSPRRSVHEQLFTGFCRDLSERQVAQNRLETLLNQLAHVSRLTAMGQLATALAHELNQPLSAISNYVSASSRLLQQSPPDLVMVDDALRAAAAETLRAGQIIVGLRSFVSKTDGRRQLQALKPIVDEAAVLAATGGQVGWLSITVPTELLPVLVDRIQIQQVLLNLIRNGVEAMEESGKTSRMWIEGRSIPGFVQISVSDNGPGVSPEFVESVLQPFVSTKATGLGIGLSISKEIIEAHGGKLWLDTSARQGAVFKFTLPATGVTDVTVTD